MKNERTDSRYSIERIDDHFVAQMFLAGCPQDRVVLHTPEEIFNWIKKQEHLLSPTQYRIKTNADRRSVAQKLSKRQARHLVRRIIKIYDDQGYTAVLGEMVRWGLIQLDFKAKKEEPQTLAEESQKVANAYCSDCSLMADMRKALARGC